MRAKIISTDTSGRPFPVCSLASKLFWVLNQSLEPSINIEYITDQDNVLETRTIDGRLIEIENRFQLSNVISIVYS